MSEHIIPEQEDDEHINSEDCPCEPTMVGINPVNGEMIWRHKIQDRNKFMDNIFGF